MGSCQANEGILVAIFTYAKPNPSRQVYKDSRRSRAGDVTPAYRDPREPEPNDTYY